MIYHCLKLISVFQTMILNYTVIKHFEHLQLTLNTYHNMQLYCITIQIYHHPSYLFLLLLHSVRDFSSHGCYHSQRGLTGLLHSRLDKWHDSSIKVKYTLQNRIGMWITTYLHLLQPSWWPIVKACCFSGMLLLSTWQRFRIIVIHCFSLVLWGHTSI